MKNVFGKRKRKARKKRKKRNRKGNIIDKKKNPEIPGFSKNELLEASAAVVVTASATAEE